MNSMLQLLRDCPILGGLIGYFYESFNFIEPKLNLHSPNIPFISICQCNEIIVFDNFKGTLHNSNNRTKTDDGYESAKRRLKKSKVRFIAFNHQYHKILTELKKN